MTEGKNNINDCEKKGAGCQGLCSSPVPLSAWEMGSGAAQASASAQTVKPSLTFPL